MDKNEEHLDPLNQLRKQISQKQPSEKPAEDVLNYKDSEPNAESQFVQTTREELDGETASTTPPVIEASPASQDRHMPDTERITEKD